MEQGRYIYIYISLCSLSNEAFFFLLFSLSFSVTFVSISRFTLSLHVFFFLFLLLPSTDLIKQLPMASFSPTHSELLLLSLPDMALAVCDFLAVSRTFFSVFIFFFSAARVSESARSFTVVNVCKETIWPAITPAGNISGGGFALTSGQSALYTAPDAWAGRIWARTGCDFDKTGTGKCRTGGCGELLNCTGPGSRPSTIADFTLGSMDYYDVSLVDGFNVPIAIQPSGGKGNCSAAGCDGDLRENCPPELVAKEEGTVVACRSACDVFHTGEYCCTGQFDNPSTCLPTNYSRSFKVVCPAAYSFGYDDPTSVLTCSSPDYVVAFCATRNQSLCSYHDKQLTCNNATSKGSRLLTAISQTCQTFILTFLFILNFGFLF